MTDEEILELLSNAENVIRRAVEAADEQGHDEAVFYAKASLAGLGASKALIRSAREVVASDKR